MELFHVIHTYHIHSEADLSCSRESSAESTFVRVQLIPLSISERCSSRRARHHEARNALNYFVPQPLTFHLALR